MDASTSPNSGSGSNVGMSIEMGASKASEGADRSGCIIALPKLFTIKA